MLIVNVSAKQLGKYRKIQLFIDGELADEVNPREVKQYSLEPGHHKVSAKMNFYKTKEQEFYVKNNNETHAYELTFREDWKFLVAMLVVGGLGIFLDLYLRDAFAHIDKIHTYMNAFTVTYFVLLFLSNVWINRYRYLKLKPFDFKQDK